MTLAELMNIDPERVFELNKKDLRHYVSQLNQKARQRVNRIKKSEVYSYAHDKYEKPKNVRKMTLNQLRAEYKRTRIFLNSPTSTITGAKRSNKKISDMFDVSDPTKVNFKQLHKVASIIKDIAPEVNYKQYLKNMIKKSTSRKWDNLPEQDKQNTLEYYGLSGKPKNNNMKVALYELYLHNAKRSALGD